MTPKLNRQHRLRHHQYHLAGLTILVILPLVVPSSVSAQTPSLEFHLTTTLSPFEKAAFGVATSTDGDRFAVAGRAGKIAVYDSENRRLNTIALDRMILALGLTPTGSLGVSLSADGVMRTHDPRNWTVLETIPLPFRCGFMAFNRSGNQVAVGGAGPHVLLYDLDTNKQIETLGEARRTQGLLFSSDDRSIIANSTLDSFAGYRSEVRILTRNSRSMRTFPSGSKELQRLVVSPDSKYFASVSTEGRIEIYDQSAGRLLRKWLPSKRLTQMAVFLPDSPRLIVGTSVGFDLYDVSEPEPILSMELPEAANAYDAAWISGTAEFLAVHTRKANQVTRWAVGNQSNPANTATIRSMATTEESTPKNGSLKQRDAMARNEEQAQVKEHSNDGFRSSWLAEASIARTWTSNVGTKLHARWVGNDSHSVLLKDEQGKDRVVRRDLLSKADDHFLNQIDRHRLPTNSADSTDRSHQRRDYRIEDLSLQEPRISRINDVAVDSFGMAWLATNLGLAILNRENQCTLIATCRDAGVEDPNRKGFCRVAVDRFDRVLVIPGNGSGNYEAGPLWRFDRMTWKRLPSIKDYRFSDVDRVGKQIIAVGDFDAIAKWDGNQWDLQSQNLFDEARDYSQLEVGKSGLVLAVSRSRESVLWNHREFIDLRPLIVRHIVIPHWRPSGELLFLDRDNSGMWRLRELNAERTRIRILYEAKKDRSRELYSFSLAEDNAIWISTVEGLFRLHGDQRQRWLDPVNGLHPLPDGRLLTMLGGGRLRLRVLIPENAEK